LQSG